MTKTVKQVIKDELYNLLDVELINEVPPKENIPVTWSWRREERNRVIEGSSKGVIISSGDKFAVVKLTNYGPNSRRPGTTIRVALKSLRSLSDGRQVISWKEYYKKAMKIRNASGSYQN